MENNMKMDRREIGCGSVDWMDVVQDRDQWLALVDTEIKLRAS
jgi:hypothetical protein